MAWLSRVNFTASDVLSYTDVNNLGNDIRAWGGNVNAGGYTLSNVVLELLNISGGSSGSSVLTLLSTTGTGTTDSIVFKTGSQVQRMKITSSGVIVIGSADDLSISRNAAGVLQIGDGGSNSNGTVRATSFTNGTNTVPFGGNNLTTAGAIPYVSAAGILNVQSGGLYFDSSTGRLALGFDTGLNEEFEVRKTRTSATGNSYGIRSTYTIDIGNNSYQFSSGLDEVLIPSSNSSNYSGLVRATYNYLRHDGSGTLSEGASSYSIIRANNNSTITTAYGLYTNTAINNAASIGTLYHIYASPAVDNSSGSIGSEYGLYVGNITSPSVGNRWAIYTAGNTNKIHFSGPVDSDSSIEMNGSAQVRADGSATAPGFATAGNPNMGMFRAANNTLGWSVSGLEQMRLPSTGNLLIGTTTDSNFKLDVAASGTSGTARFYGGSGVTASTKVVVQAGGGQSGNLMEWQAANGVVRASVGSVGDFIGSSYDNGGTWEAGSSLNRLSNTYRVQWSSTGSYAGAADLSLSRASAGVLQVGDGGSNANGVVSLTRSQHAGVLVAALPAAAAGNAGSIQYVTDANATTIGSTVAGGGANKVMVWSDGAAWKIFAS